MSVQKRQATSYDCAQQGNQHPYCSPLTTDTWVNGSTYEFIWNYNFPYYVNSPSLNLYLYYIKNYQYTQIKQWSDIHTNDGSMSVLVDDTWFPTPDTDGKNKTWSLYLYYLPSTVNASSELQNTLSQYPRPYNFSVIQFPSTSLSTTSSNNTNSPLSPSSSSLSSSSNQQHGLPNWGIALIVIASVAVAAALGVLAWAFLIYFPRRRQRRRSTNRLNGGTKGPASYGQHHPSPSSSNEKAESIYSDTPIMHTGLRSSVSVGATTAPSSVSHPADSPSYPSIHHITSLNPNDALNDSYRQMIHRPDWTTIDEDIDQEKRRQLGEELLQRQLAEDGSTTMIKQTQPNRLKSMTSQIPKARTAVVVAESTDSLSSTTSSHPPR
ncbi:uncharacterized protein BX664DRAFT_285305 [Halteromyces radiatus]|uniref:uncharacterized protein n=1 Tax=Halteromyces radiatus TaxID=101107 RepID=UPI0022205576|nr:uncharacterized protein BX664DRAFT_285305 [Halteromyces radiatus]KAI8081350.1 hypothetical protein BX664DRAFT_285305 [Halteromyces radiatus]